jgi:hypothetical protein
MRSNRALRAGSNGPEGTPKIFKVEPFALGLLPGIDADKMNQLLDQLDWEEFIRKL